MIATTIGVIGISGSGKSYFSANLLKNENRIVVFDPTCDSAFDYLFPIDNVRDLVYSMSKADFQLAFRPNAFEDFAIGFQALLYFSNYYLLIDEMALFCTPHIISDELRQLSYMKRRRNRICFIWTSQRPKEVHLAITSQTLNIVSFYLDDSSSLDFLPSIWRKSGELSTLKIAEFDGMSEYRIVKGRNDLLQKAFPHFQP